MSSKTAPYRNGYQPYVGRPPEVGEFLLGNTKKISSFVLNQIKILGTNTQNLEKQIQDAIEESFPEIKDPKFAPIKNDMSSSILLGSFFKRSK